MGDHQSPENPVPGRRRVSPSDLHALSIDLLRRAVEIYLKVAYPNVSPPEVVLRRTQWPSGVDGETLVSKPPFEKVPRSAPDAPVTHALRLGNSRYPHMKLQVQPWPTASGCLLSVNTHDHVSAPDPTSPEAEPFRALQAENQRLKESIEHAWDAAGLPTFLRYLREYIQAQGQQPAKGLDREG
jgi:hypothetical protein